MGHLYVSLESSWDGAQIENLNGKEPGHFTGLEQ